MPNHKENAVRDAADVPDLHTPGPWEWQFMGTAGRWCLVNAEGLGAVHVGGPPNQSLSADQRLIQAAPSMLEALQDAQRRLREIAILAHESGQQDIYNVAYHGAVRRAIRKATEG